MNQFNSNGLRRLCWASTCLVIGITIGCDITPSLYEEVIHPGYVLVADDSWSDMWLYFDDGTHMVGVVPSQVTGYTIERGKILVRGLNQPFFLIGFHQLQGGIGLDTDGNLFLSGGYAGLPLVTGLYAGVGVGMQFSNGTSHDLRGASAVIGGNNPAAGGDYNYFRKADGSRGWTGDLYPPGLNGGLGYEGHIAPSATGTTNVANICDGLSVWAAGLFD